MKTNLLFSCWTLPFVCAPVFTVSAHDGAKQHEANGQKPNILLIVTDQQSFNMVSCAGNRYIHTPNLDRIAQNGYMFNNTYCANPVSMPSRFALITGQFSSKVGIKGNTTKVNREKVLETVHQYSIGNVFRANGTTRTILERPTFMQPNRRWTIMVLNCTAKIPTKERQRLPNRSLPTQTILPANHSSCTSPS